MLSLILLLWPALAALVVLMVKGESTKHIALGAALVEFGLAMSMLGGFDPAGGLQYQFSIPWVAQAGIHFTLAVDGITLLMVLLTVFLVPLIILSAFNHPYRNPSAFYALILFMQSGLLGVFMAMVLSRLSFYASIRVSGTRGETPRVTRILKGRG